MRVIVLIGNTFRYMIQCLFAAVLIFTKIRRLKFTEQLIFWCSWMRHYAVC